MGLVIIRLKANSVRLDLSARTELGNIVKNLRYLEKSVLELRLSATIKAGKIEGSIFSTRPNRTNLSLQTDLGSIGCLVPEKLVFSDSE